MKVGDYVRYKTLSNQIKINKIKNIVEPYDSELSMTNIILYDLDNKDVTADKYIIKSSPNIIDLIEENDLIEIEYKISTGENQKEIVQIIKNVNNKLFIKTYTGHYVFIEDIEKTIYKIKGIITCEQFSQMEYKVKE